MSELKNYLIDEKHVSQLEEVLSLLATDDVSTAFLILDGIITDIVNWCEVKK